MLQTKLCQCEFAKAGNFLTRNKTFKNNNTFLAFMKLLETNTCFKKIDPKENFHSHLGFSENWYECIACKKIWHLVGPQLPYRGLWEEWDQESHNNFKATQKEPCECEFTIYEQFLKYVGVGLKPNSYLKKISPKDGFYAYYDIANWYECQLCKKIWFYGKWERSACGWHDWARDKQDSFEMGHNKLCRCEFWKAERFKGPVDFIGFKEALSTNPYLKKTKSRNNLFSKLGFLETWHECLRCRRNLYLIEPTTSFAGLWRSVRAPYWLFSIFSNIRYFLSWLILLLKRT